MLHFNIPHSKLQIPHDPNARSVIGVKGWRAVSMDVSTSRRPYFHPSVLESRTWIRLGLDRRGAIPAHVRLSRRWRPRLERQAALVVGQLDPDVVAVLDGTVK